MLYSHIRLGLHSHMVYAGIVQCHILKAKSPFPASAAPTDYTRQTKTGKSLLEMVTTVGFVIKLLLIMTVSLPI